MTETEVLEIASSWSLRNHYSRDLSLQKYGDGKTGYAICNGRTKEYPTKVYDDAALRGNCFDQRALDKPRKMCKVCERMVGNEWW